MRSRLTTAERVRLALNSLASNPLRAGVNLMGILLGVAAVILLVAVSGGAARAVQSQVESSGSDLIVVYPSSGAASGLLGLGSGSSLTQGDADALGDPGLVPDAIQAVPTAQLKATASYSSRNWTTDVIGTSDGFADIRGYQIDSGQFFTAADVRAAIPVAVVGQTVVDNLFAGGDAAGRLIKVNGHPYRVGGVLTRRGSVGAFNQDDIVVVPITTAWAYLLQRTDPKVQQILVQARTPDVAGATADEVTRVLLRRHQLKSPDQADFTVQSQTDLINNANRVSSLLSRLLTAVALIALVVGAVGIANMMLVSVVARTREIGIRMAVGARRGDIRSQFMLESVFLAVIGGILGVALGILLAAVLPDIVRDLPSPVVSLTSVGLALVLSVLIGVVSGIYPAVRASRLQPMEALRHE